MAATPSATGVFDATAKHVIVFFLQSMSLTSEKEVLVG